MKCDKSLEEPLFMSRQQLHPYAVKGHLRELWSKEETVLRHVFAVLSSDESSCELPTDLFFKQTQVVPPTRFRQVNWCPAFT